MTQPTLRAVESPPSALSVGELNRAVKATVEENHPSLWVQGEITAVKINAGSGHVYFDLKDDREEARVSCVMWRGNAQRARANLANGERVVLKGRPGVYVPRGQFQFTAEIALPAGAGVAAAALAALKLKLQAEGLFDAARKRPLPRFPRGIGVVTSASGAAFQDICKEAHRRWPARIVLAPSLVQGADAPAQIVRAIVAIQRVPGLDVIIVGRGGGASEDLSAFNDETVARAIATCRLPVVSAVGHEIDFTIADAVADHRAATPTMAATLCLPEWTEEQNRVVGLEQHLCRAMLSRVQTGRLALSRKALRDPRRRLHDLRQRSDDLTRRLQDALEAKLHAGRQQIDRADRALQTAHPKTRLATHHARMEALGHRLGPAMVRAKDTAWQRLEALDVRLAQGARGRLVAPRHAVAQFAGRLHALSPLAILERGYSVVLRQGRALTASVDVTVGEVLTVRLHHGELDARVEAVRGDPGGT